MQMRGQLAAPGRLAGRAAGRARVALVRAQSAAAADASTAAAATKAPVAHKYCESTHQTRRRPTRTVKVGKVLIGSEHPIALQTMTTTDTRDVAATVAQVKACADAGADLVRITVQGRKEAEACAQIRAALDADGYDVPLVADIHFQPAVAMMVAEAFEKIRINPGNFADGRKTFEEIDYDDPKAFEEERAEIERTFTPLVLKCKELGRAMRIGTNHGSLSARILSFYGDTPRGMVESAFEFAEICRKHDYHNFVFSMKASNPLVMVAAYRLLAEEMYARGWDYPLHLGVTEAGEGEDGRMKSAIGIGALLMDGLGDTIRVSLTEDPELEMDPCRRLAALGTDAAKRGVGVEKFDETTRDTHAFARREGELPAQREGEALDYRTVLHPSGSVFSALSLDELDANAELAYRKLGCKLAVGIPLKDIATSDSVFMRELPPSGDADGRRALRRLQESGVHVVAPLEAAAADPMPGVIPVLPLSALAPGAAFPALPAGAERFAVRIDGTESDATIAAALAPGQAPERTPVCALLDPEAPASSGGQAARLHASRRVFEALQRAGSCTPVIHHVRYPEGADRDEIVIATGSRVGGLLVDGLGDGVLIEVEKNGADLDFLRTTSFGLLQGCRMRNIKTEFVSCPSCGRTLFDLQEVTEEIRQKTGHLPFVTIAVMGCIVNGPGEMADADVGYVGGAPGKIDLYVGKEVVKRGIPMEGASDALVQLIKDIGKWVDKEDEEDGDGGAGGVAAAGKQLAGAASA